MMTAVGRGRGNWGSKDLSAPLRRPGEAPRTSGGEEDIIMKELASLDINDNPKVELLENQIKKYCVNREHLWKICQKMYESGAKDRSMVPKVVKFWKNLAGFEVNDVKLRSVLMSTAQKDFEEREDIRNDDPERFLNAVALLGGIFHNVTLPGGGIFNVLVSPMMEYWELLLREGSKDSKLREAELEMLATQVNLNGPVLDEQAKETLDTFHSQVRETVTSPLPSIRCQHWLLLVIDLSTHGWTVQELPSCLRTYYAEKLGKSFDQLVANAPKRSQKSESIYPVNKIIADSLPVVVPKKVEVKFPDESSAPSRDFSYDKPYRKSQPPDGDQKDRRKPAYWGHDDRFDDVDDSTQGRSRGKCRDGVAKDLTPHHLLMQDVFCSYDKGVRPVLQHSANITITTKLYIKFFSLDEVNNVMNIHAWLALTWKDAFLQWTPSDYGNISILHVSIKEIWVPDLSIYNSGDLSMSMGFKGSQCLIYSNGDILCVPVVKWPAYCLANYRLWPYDIQECKLIIGSWNHNGEAVDISLSERGFSLDEYTQSREWELKNVTAFKNISMEECCPNETYLTAEYKFIISRHASAYSATVVIPSLVCVCMVLATFWLPPKLPHRMSLCLVSIVCHCLYLQYLGAKLPSNGDVTPVIFIFFRGSLIICGAALVWSVTLLSLSSESTSRSIGKETGLFTVSRLLEVIQKPWVAQILCLGQLRPKMAPVEGHGAALAEDAAEVNGTNVNEWLILSPALDCLAFYVFSLAYALMIIITLIPLHN